MTLVEVSVSVGLLSLLIFSSSQSIVWQSKFVSNLKGARSLSNLATRMHHVITDGPSCSETLKTLNPVAGQNFSIIKRKDNLGIYTEYAVNNLYEQETLKLVNLTVNNFRPTKAANRGIVDLTIEAQPNIGLIKNVNVSQTFSVEVDLDASNKILSCAGTKESYAQSICSGLGGVVINGVCTDLKITNNLTTSTYAASVSGNVQTPNFLANTITASNLNAETVTATNYVNSLGPITAQRIEPLSGSLNHLYHSRIVSTAGKICFNGVCRNFAKTACGLGEAAKGINADGTLRCLPVPPGPPLPK